jgi:hypothetical protein
MAKRKKYKRTHNDLQNIHIKLFRVAKLIQLPLFLFYSTGNNAMSVFEQM